MTRAACRRAALELLARTSVAVAPAPAPEPQRILALVTAVAPQVQGMAFVLLNG